MSKRVIDERSFVSDFIAKKIEKRKYYRKNNQGKYIEDTWEQVALRVANYVSAGGEGKTSAEKEEWAERYFTVIKDKIFIPGGRILANAGTPIKNLINCFIFDIQDSRNSIYTVLRDVAEVHSQGGGTGMNFSNLREEGALIKSTGGKASGPISFTKLFDVSAEVIKQASRRGAMLASLNVLHPDIYRFMAAKSEENVLQNFNISVAVPDEVLLAYESDTFVTLFNGAQTSARKLIHTLAEWAWKRGDPGLLFIDTLNRGNPIPHQGKIVSTNPCGEIPGIHGSSCNLGSLNLVKFLYKKNNKYYFDFEYFAEVVALAIRFLNDVVSVTKTGVSITDDVKEMERKIGLGVMGFADVLSYLRIAYDSEEAREFAKTLGKTMYFYAQATSRDLSIDMGPYPGYSSESIDPVTLEAQGEQRNSALLAIAPTGSISLVAGVNGSIEPYFLLAYRKNFRFGAGKTTESHIISSHTLKTILQEEFPVHWEAVLNHVSLQGNLTPNEAFTEEVNVKIKHLQPFFKTAYDISPMDHLLMQAAWQENIDLSISKTVNLPADITVEAIEELIVFAWKQNIKGFTVFRDGCRSEQIMEKPTKK